MWKRLAEQDESSSRKQGNRDEEIQKFLDILSSKRHQEVDLHTLIISIIYSYMNISLDYGGISVSK